MGEGAAVGSAGPATPATAIRGDILGDGLDRVGAWEGQRGSRSPYRLRRSHAAHVSAKGVLLVNIAKRMGHTMKTLIDHYLKAGGGGRGGT
jgi:integrase